MTKLWQTQWQPLNQTQDDNADATKLVNASPNPFVSDAFLLAMEQSGACNFDSGWQPSHLTIDDRLSVPAYIKTNSWGEYVFDWSWAQAYEQAGLRYYPKLVVAAPYTPSMGPRLLGAQSEEDTQTIIEQLKKRCHEQQLSGFHILFPNAKEQHWLNQQNLIKRQDIQFHWHNRSYDDFDHFLSGFISRKRKNVRKERRSIAEQRIEMSVLTGQHITDKAWHAFYQFYHATYLKRGRQGYLNKSFFDAIRASLPEQLVLVMAAKEGQYIAGALCFKDNDTLYGRYWGCMEEYNNLHFEACYYQGIEYCIRHGLKRFDPGTQGEHKIARGFEPTVTHSYHWLAHPQFFEAAANFCKEEKVMIESYLEQTQQSLPFKKT